MKAIAKFFGGAGEHVLNTLEDIHYDVIKVSARYGASLSRRIHLERECIVSSRRKNPAATKRTSWTAIIGVILDDQRTVRIVRIGKHDWVFLTENAMQMVVQMKARLQLWMAILRRTGISTSVHLSGIHPDSSPSVHLANLWERKLQFLTINGHVMPSAYSIKTMQSDTQAIGTVAKKLIDLTGMSESQRIVLSVLNILVRCGKFHTAIRSGLKMFPTHCQQQGIFKEYKRLINKRRQLRQAYDANELFIPLHVFDDSGCQISGLVTDRERLLRADEKHVVRRIKPGHSHKPHVTLANPLQDVVPGAPIADVYRNTDNCQVPSRAVRVKQMMAGARNAKALIGPNLGDHRNIASHLQQVAYGQILNAERLRMSSTAALNLSVNNMQSYWLAQLGQTPQLSRDMYPKPRSGSRSANFVYELCLDNEGKLQQSLVNRQTKVQSMRFEDLLDLSGQLQHSTDRPDHRSRLTDKNLFNVAQRNLLYDDVCTTSQPVIANPEKPHRRYIPDTHYEPLGNTPLDSLRRFIDDIHIKILEWHRAELEALCVHMPLFDANEGHLLKTEIDGQFETASSIVIREVESHVFFHLRREIFTCLECTMPYDTEIEFSRALRQYENVSQTDLHIPENLRQPDGWAAAIVQLRISELASLPSQKLLVIHGCWRAIVALHDQRQKQVRAKPSILGADDLLPIFAYVTVKAKLQRPMWTIALIRALADPFLLQGEAGYALTTFEIALQYIRDRYAGTTT